MGFSKDEKSIRLLRAVKTLFFLITMLISLLLFSAPVLLVIADTLLPSALLSASLSPSSLSLQTLSSHLQNYDFRYSLIDIPLISILRSAIIICKCLIFLYPFGFLNQNNMLNYSLEFRFMLFLSMSLQVFIACAMGQGFHEDHIWGLQRCVHFCL